MAPNTYTPNTYTPNTYTPSVSKQLLSCANLSLNRQYYLNAHFRREIRQGRSPTKALVQHLHGGRR